MTITTLVQLGIMIAFMAALIMLSAWVNDLQKSVQTLKQACKDQGDRISTWRDIINEYMDDEAKRFSDTCDEIAAVHDFVADNKEDFDQRIEQIYEEKNKINEQIDQIVHILKGVDKRSDELEMFIKTQDEKNYQNSKCLDELVNRSSSYNHRLCGLEEDAKVQTKTNIEIRSRLDLIRDCEKANNEVFEDLIANDRNLRKDVEKIDKVFDLVDGRLKKIEEKMARVDDGK